MSVTSVSVDTEADESDPKEKDQDKERDGATNGCDQVNGGDTEPDPEVEANCAFGFTGVRGALGVDTGLAVVFTHETEEGDQDNCVTPPEHAEGAEDSSTESVTSCELPETSKELSKTTVGKSETENGIGDLDAKDSDVVEREEEGGGRETEHC